MLVTKRTVARFGLRLLTLGLSFSLLSATFLPFAAAAPSSAAALTPEVSASDFGDGGLGASITSILGTSNTQIGSIILTLTPPSPQDAQIQNAMRPALFTCSVQTNATTGAVTVSGSGVGVAAPSELAFLPVGLTAPVNQLVPMTLTFQSLKDTTGSDIGLPAPVTVSRTLS